MRGTTVFAVVLAAVLVVGCGDDDTAPSSDGVKDAGGKSGTGKANAGSGAASKGGQGGTSGDSGAGSGGRKDGGGGTSGVAGDSGTRADGGVPSDGGAMDSGAADGATQPAPGCQGLMQCCAQLPTAQRMSCELITMNADDATCDQVQSIYCMPASTDAAVASCAALDQCCQTLPLGLVRVACATTVSSGMAQDCQQVMVVYCPDGGDPDACATLTSCCAGLPPPRRANCNTIVQAGLPSACQSAEASLCP
ncbi:MAG TPA: hypothetical protein VK524_21900 [Polyangiaceae bacterium]|nr:hypothetical protein [Polyangiaceae bacterium]